MKVLDVYVTEGVSINADGKKNNWKSRVAICLDTFQAKDCSGEYIKTLKLTPDCEVPDCDDDVQPLFNGRGDSAKVAAFISTDR